VADGAVTERSAVEPGARTVRLLSTAGVALLRGWRKVTTTWQRSLQLRVITATLALSLAVVSLLGVTLTRQITEDLLKQEVDAAGAHAATYVETGQQRLESADEVNTRVLRDIAQELDNLGGPEGPRVLLHQPGAPTVFTGAVSLATVPPDMRESVAAEPFIFWTYTTIEYRGDDHTEPGLVAGGQVQSFAGSTEERYGLYFVFSLAEQEQTLGVVRTALWTAGLLLVLLLGAIAGLVTRQVVTPVRMAARIAERFSAGKLSERMVTRGKDDIAKLASSFNQMAGSLQEQISQLEELSRIQQQFASDVSHELRTPLTTVRMAADVLYESREDFDPAVNRSAELLQVQLDRFEALLGDLLEISRFDAGVAALHAERVDLRDLVFQVTDSAAHLAARKGSDVDVDTPAEPCMAEIDTRRIERVLRNLVVNAIEHGEGRSIQVTVAGNDHAVAVTVRDYGVGLKPGESSLVFHRFWRADPARARTTGGTGLGLAISLEDTRLHGGWLQAWGEPGGGSQFRLTLPRTANGELTTSPLPYMPVDATYDSRLSGVGSPYRRVSNTSANGMSAAAGPADPPQQAAVQDSEEVAGA
jgi:two-component system sensor histidine kinase MtrB